MTYIIRKSAKDEVSTSIIKLAAVTAMGGSGMYIAVKGGGGGERSQERVGGIVRGRGEEEQEEKQTKIQTKRKTK